MPPGATGATGPDTFGPIGPTSVVVDECLKLSTRKRVCALPSLGGGVGSLFVRSGSQTEFGEVDFPEFLLITSPQDRAELVRFTVGDTTVEGPMHRVPGGNWDTDRAAVLITDVPEGQPIPVCNPDPPPMQPSEGLSVARVDLYDAAGTHLGCGGM